MATVTGPSGAELERAVQSQPSRLRYDEVSDSLYISFGEPTAAVSFDANGELWIRFVPSTGQVVGLEVEGFQRDFLPRHVEVAHIWNDPALSRLSRLSGEGSLEQIGALIQVITALAIRYLSTTAERGA